MGGRLPYEGERCWSWPLAEQGRRDACRRGSDELECKRRAFNALYLLRKRHRKHQEALNMHPVWVEREERDKQGQSRGAKVRPLGATC